MPTFNQKLDRVLNEMADEPVDYYRDWQKLRAQRPKGGPVRGITNTSDGRRPYHRSSRSQMVYDIEMAGGVELPSMKGRGLAGGVVIPWAVVDTEPPNMHDMESDSEVIETFPFVQFSEETWPAMDDFDVDIYPDDPAMAMQIYNSDKNHYHMLTGADKEFIDDLVFRYVESWNMETEHERDEEEAYDENGYL